MSYSLGTASGKIVLDYDGSGVDAAKKDVDGLEQKTGKTSGAVKKLGNVSGIAGLAIAGGMAVGVNAAANFEKRMSAVGAVSGANAKELKGLSDKALQLGKDTQFSASEAASAIEELVKAGISIPDVMNGAADSVVNLAAAGEVDMKTAATIASNAMNQFGIKAKDMGATVDSIAGAANASAIDVTDFGTSLAQVGAVAHLNGVKFSDTATAIALMGNAGIKGSDAGTSLKSMLMRLQPTTKAAYEEMQGLGLITFDAAKGMQVLKDNGIKPLGSDSKTVRAQLATLTAEMSGSKVGSAKQLNAFTKLGLQTGALRNQFYKANGDTKSLSEISGVLGGSLEKLNKRQKSAALQTLFGSDAIRGAAVLAGEGSKGFDKMGKSMGKVSAADVAKKRMDNFAGSLEQMKGSLETAGISVGTILLPPLRKLVDFLTGILNKFLNLSDTQRKWILVVVAAVGALLLIISAIIKTVFAVQKIIEVMKILRLAFASTWVAALGPIALIIAAIAAVIAIFVILYKKNETFRKIVDRVWKAVKIAIAAVADWIVNKLVPWLVKAWDNIKGPLNTLFKFWKAVWGLIWAIVKLAFRIIKAGIQAGMDLAKKVIGGAVDFIKKIWDKLWGAMPDTVKDKIKSIMDKIKGLKDKVIGFFKGAGDWLLNAGKEIMQGLIDGIGKMMKKVTDKIHSVTDKIGKFFPGSPVKEGPLRKLNHGHSGSEIVKMLITGMDSMTPDAVAKMNEITGMMAPPPSSYVPPSGPRRPPGSGGGGRTLNLTIPVHNPKPERASQSVDKVLRTKIEAEGWSVG